MEKDKSPNPAPQGLPPASGHRRGRRGAAALVAEAEGRRRQPRRRRPGDLQQRPGPRHPRRHGSHEPPQLGRGFPPSHDSAAGEAGAAGRRLVVGSSGLAGGGERKP
jgi:hypothetical protein